MKEEAEDNVCTETTESHNNDFFLALSTCCFSQPMDDVIQQLQLHLKPEMYEIQVCRHDVLSGLVKETTRTNFDPMKRIKVGAYTL